METLIGLGEGMLVPLAAEGLTELPRKGVKPWPLARVCDLHYVRAQNWNVGTSVWFV